MKFTHIRTMLLGGGVALALGGALAAAPAHATARSVQVSTPMTAVHAVRVLGATPGHADHVNVLLADGRTVSIESRYQGLVEKRSAAEARAATPFDQLPGSCGSSYIWVNYKSDLEPVHMDTGFDVTPAPAISYQWHASIHGDSGTGYDYDYWASGDLNFDWGWHGQHSSGNDYPTGDYTAAVYADGSAYALLSNGEICTSVGPWDEQYLYH